MLFFTQARHAEVAAVVSVAVVEEIEGDFVVVAVVVTEEDFVEAEVCPGVTCLMLTAGKHKYT